MEIRRGRGRKGGTEMINLTVRTRIRRRRIEEFGIQGNTIPIPPQHCDHPLSPPFTTHD